MIVSSLSNVAEALAATVVGNDVNFTGVSIDTRTLVAGNLYIAIAGDKFDGHTFCSEAISAGAAALLVEHRQNLPVPQLLVKDTRNALRELAIFWRNQFDVPMVAVTGSNGKTTVKEMIASVFSRCGKTLATAGNFNNDLGVPLTLLRLSKDDCRAVIEIGANHAGEIEDIVTYVRPTIALVTMIGPAHLEGFGSIEAIANAKSEIYTGLQTGGLAVVNRDDKFFESMCEAVTGDTLTFGTHQDADIRAEIREEGTLLITPEGRATLQLKLIGAHNRQNAMAATAVAIGAGISLEKIVAGLEALEAVPGRLQVRSEIKGFRVIDDTYNANPASVMAAIDVLDEMTSNRCLVLGDMAELGITAAELHKRVGAYASRVDKQLFSVGAYSHDLAEGFGHGAIVCKDVDAMFKVFIDKVSRGSNVLVKGSRSSNMEVFIEKIREWDAVHAESKEVLL